MAVSVASMARKCFAVAVAGAAAMGRAATRLLCVTDAQSMRFDAHQDAMQQILCGEFFAEFHEVAEFPQNGRLTRFPTGHAEQRSPLPSV